MAQKHILIICGEASGDLNAAKLAQRILEIDPGLKISGVGGNFLRQAQAEVFYDIKDLAVIGFFDVLRKLPKFLKLRKILLQKIESEKPNLIILVDFSGFNLRIAKLINKSIPVIYYISPQVWASRPGRIKTIRKFISKMIVLFKFEEEFYRLHGINVDFVGHPLLGTVKPKMEKKDFLAQFDLDESKTTLALLPGSRKAEIKYILPVMLKAAKLIRKSLNNLQFILAKAPNVDLYIYKRIMRKFALDIKIIEDKTYDCLNIADFCWVASGTATLEAAILKKPMLIIYKMSLLNYLLYRPQVKLPYIGMVNIVVKRKIIPEFIQFKAQPEKIADATIKIITNKPQLEQMEVALTEVKSSLGEKGAAQRAAQIIIDFIRNF